MNRENILYVIQGPMSENHKWYYCPHCKNNFNFLEITNQQVAKCIDRRQQLYKCNNCNKIFKMYE